VRGCRSSLVEQEVAAVAAAKARVLDRPRAVCLGVTAVIPAGFISGHLVISAIDFLGARRSHSSPWGSSCCGTADRTGVSSLPALVSVP
jgi:hypothetical protein